MKKIVFLLLISLVTSTGFTQSEKFKALFVYNFTKNIDWTAAYKQGDFVIGVYGNSPMIAELIKIANKKKTGNQTIVIKKYSAPHEIHKCHILYLPRNKSSRLPTLQQSLSGKPTLIISDKEGLKGADINFLDQNRSLEFEINPAQIRRKGLKVGSSLVSLGIVIK